jgi:hypothetical protein
MAKKQSVKAVKVEAPQVEEEMIDEEIETVAFEPITDEEYQELIEQGKKLFEELYEIPSICHRIVITPEMAASFLTRNERNRYPDPAIIKKYAQLHLENRVDAHGNPVKGTNRWEKELPVSVHIDSDGNLHNSQKCFMALLEAMDTLLMNAEQAKDQKAKIVNIQEKTGITPESLFITGVVIDGFPPSAADYIDKGQVRTNADIGYRKGLFDEFDFSDYVRKPRENEDETKYAMDVMKKTKRIKRDLSKKHATVLSYIYKRIHGKGASPRGKASYGSTFSTDMYNAGCDEYPELVSSVLQLFTEYETNKETYKKTKVPMEYLMAAHFLAANHNSTLNKKKEWESKEGSFEQATEFIRSLVTDPKPSPLVQAWKKELDTLERNDKTLNAIWKSLGYLWRNFAFGDEVALDVAMAESTPQASYAEEQTAASFDKKHLPSTEELQLAQEKSAKAKLAAKPIVSSGNGKASPKKPQLMRK